MLRRSLMILSVLVVVAPFILTMPLAVEAQTTISARAATLQIGGRLHGQYQGSSVDAAAGDFFIRRARLITDATFNDFFVGRVQVDFAEGDATLLDAYVRMDFHDGLRLSVGQFKRSFDIFELASSTDLSVVERTGAIRGLDTCTGVGSVCSFSHLTEALRYAGRDVGVRAEGVSGTLSYQATVTNGTGVVVRDENDGMSFSGRAGIAASENLTVSVNVGFHDYRSPPLLETEHAFAWAGDVQYGTWREGYLLQAAVAGGDNWRSLGPGSSPERFLAAQAIGSYYHPLDGDRIIGIEPLLRVSVADPNGSVDDDGGTLLTPGVMLYLLGRNKIGANFDYYLIHGGGSEFSLRLATFLYF